jgi:hypothetical protein
MVKVFWNKLFTISEQGDQWLRNGQSGFIVILRKS